MIGAFFLALVAITSAGAIVVGTRALGLPASRLGRAGLRALDCIGLTTLFLVANLAVGGAVIVGLRAAGHFVSIYWLNDHVLLILSLLQALAFDWWWRAPHR